MFPRVAQLFLSSVAIALVIGSPRAAHAATPALPQAATSTQSSQSLDPSRPANVGFSTVPKVYVLSLGAVPVYKSALPQQVGEDTPLDGTQFGGEVVGEFLWQVSGFRGKIPSWIGFYLGWLHVPATASVRQTGVLQYGLRIRHAYRASERVRPFWTYCLGATQVWVNGVPGRGITHQTRGGLGVDIQLVSRLRLMLSLEWLRQTLPTIGAEKDQSFSAVSLGVGLLFERFAK
ncbi:MAG: hypothetical protein KC502_16825 [Myxococcales bacterium]|nr:hypothetical protein [Myxococcales bacterium]